MTTRGDEYKGWVALIVPPELREAAAEFIARETGKPENNTPDYFRVALCTLGDPHGEPVAYMGTPRARQRFIDSLYKVVPDWPGCHVILLRHDDLPASWRVHVPTWLASLGYEIWEPEGLSVIE